METHALEAILWAILPQQGIVSMFFSGAGRQPISASPVIVLCIRINALLSAVFIFNSKLELELELIQTQMAQKPMLRAEVGMRVRCANKASAE